MSAIVIWYGTAYDDVMIFGGDQADIVYAGAGNDNVSDGQNTLWSSDMYYGQSGNDTLFSRHGYDTLSGGGGDDMLIVRSAQYDANKVPGGVYSPEEDWRGFDVHVQGGAGNDTLQLKNSGGYSLEVVDDATIITTRFGGTITVTDVENFEFL